MSDTPHHCEPHDVTAFLSRLNSLADPEQEAFPTFENTDWRALATTAARIIEYQCDAEIARLRDELRTTQESRRAAIEDMKVARDALVGALANTVRLAADRAKIAAHNAAMDAECQASYRPVPGCDEDHAPDDIMCRYCPRRHRIEVDPCA